MLHAILHGHLECGNLLLELWQPNHDPEFDISIPPEDHIHHHLTNVMACINGDIFDKELLRHAVLERYEMQEWCERMKIALPDFWFPKDMDWQCHFLYGENGSHQLQSGSLDVNADEVESKSRNIVRQRIKMACQQIALSLWEKNPKLTIKEVAISSEVQQLGGGSKYELETVNGWLGEVDPRVPSAKRGRKRTNNLGLENSEKL
jgi:hypothetical protein